MNKQEKHNKELLNLLNKTYLKLTDIGPDDSLYTMTVKFNYLKNFKSNGQGEYLAENRLLLLLYSMFKRLFYKPLEDNVTGLAFMDYNSDEGGAHAHLLMRVNEERFKRKYNGDKFTSFVRNNKNKWIIPTNSRGKKDLLKEYWVGVWDGSSAMVGYSSKKYRSDGLFSGSSPLYFNGLIKPPGAGSGLLD